MKTGISQIVFPAEQPTVDFLAQAAEAGYESVELVLRKEGDLTAEATQDHLLALADRACELKLELSSLVLSHTTGNLLATGDEQALSIEQTRAGLRIANTLGITCTLHTLGRLSPDLYYEDAYRNGVAALKALAPTCDETDVDIAIEFVWNGFLFSPLEMRRFIQETQSPRIGFYFDPGNMAVFQHPQHWVRALGSHIKRVHLKDWKGRALNGQWTPLLEGEVDFPIVMRELKAVGFNGALTSEVDLKQASPAQTRQAIDRIIAMA